MPRVHFIRSEFIALIANTFLKVFAANNFLT